MNPTDKFKLNDLLAALPSSPASKTDDGGGDDFAIKDDDVVARATLGESFAENHGTAFKEEDRIVYQRVTVKGRYVFYRPFYADTGEPLPLRTTPEELEELPDEIVEQRYYYLSIDWMVMEETPAAFQTYEDPQEYTRRLDELLPYPTIDDAADESLFPSKPLVPVLVDKLSRGLGCTLRNVYLQKVTFGSLGGSNEQDADDMMDGNNCNSTLPAFCEDTLPAFGNCFFLADPNEDDVGPETSRALDKIVYDITSFLIPTRDTAFPLVTYSTKKDFAEAEAGEALLTEEERQQQFELIEAKLQFSRIKREYYMSLLTIAPYPSDEPMTDDEIFEYLDSFSTSHIGTSSRGA